MLAGKGVASSVGVVPGKLENRDDAISQLADLLEMKVEDIERKLSAKWVKEDSFVPLKTIPKVDELKLLSLEPDKETLDEKERHEKLLEIPGVKISDIGIREYPLGEAAAHLVGYVQNVTAEDLEEHDGEGYTSNSVIGKSGMEGLFEKELKGQNGCSITIVDSNGNKKKIIVSTIVENGKEYMLFVNGIEKGKKEKSVGAVIHEFASEIDASAWYNDDELAVSGNVVYRYRDLKNESCEIIEEEDSLIYQTKDKNVKYSDDTKSKKNKTGDRKASKEESGIFYFLES